MSIAALHHKPVSIVEKRRTGKRVRQHPIRYHKLPVLRHSQASKLRIDHCSIDFQRDRAVINLLGHLLIPLRLPLGALLRLFHLLRNMNQTVLAYQKSQQKHQKRPIENITLQPDPPFFFSAASDP